MELSEQNIKQYIAGAPDLHSALQQVYANAQIAGEVDYFRAVLFYLANKPQCHLYETHQHPVAIPNTNIQCEISDLVLVSYSPKRLALKVNFLQAKLAKFSDNKQGLIKEKGESFLKFHMDGTQYRLLKDCPNIKPLNTGLPPNILSDACTDSITSYGVFYKNGQSIEMAYEITQLLKPYNLSKIHLDSGDRVCFFDTIQLKYGIFPRTICHGWRYRPLWDECFRHYLRHPDLVSSINSNEFESALLNFQVGSPICGQLAIEFVNAIISRWNKNGEVADFERFAQESMPLWEEQEQIRRQYIDGMNGNGEDGYREGLRFDERVTSAAKYILFINVDAEQDRRDEGIK